MANGPFARIEKLYRSQEKDRASTCRIDGTIDMSGSKARGGRARGEEWRAVLCERVSFIHLSFSGDRDRLTRPQRDGEPGLVESGDGYRILHEARDSKARLMHDIMCRDGGGGDPVARADGDRPATSG